MPTRILIADDHEVVIQGIKAILASQSEWEVCGEARNGREAIDLTLKLKPDVLITDISLPEMNGLEATERILHELPGTRVLILSAHESETLLRRMLASGARGYILKTDAGETLVAAVDALIAGRLYFSSTLSDLLLEGLRTNRNGEDSSMPAQQRLTSREREVLQLLAEGKTNKDIATSCNISVKTVETHRSNLMAKLHLRSLSDIVRYAIHNEIVHP